MILAAALAAGCLVAFSSSAVAATKNYDCTKAGNADKAACKNAVQAATKAAAKPLPAAKACTGACSRHGGVGTWS